MKGKLFHANGNDRKAVVAMLTLGKIDFNKNPGTSLGGGPVVKNLPANAGSSGSIPGHGRSHRPRAKPVCQNY